MVIGVIYGYYRAADLIPCYVGKASGIYTVSSVLNQRHRSHLRGNLRIDEALRADPNAFDLHILNSITAPCSSILRPQLKQLERDTILRFKPTFNRTFLRAKV